MPYDPNVPISTTSLAVKLLAEVVLPYKTPPYPLTPSPNSPDTHHLPIHSQAVALKILLELLPSPFQIFVDKAH